MKYTHTQTSIPEENEYPKLVRDKIPSIIKDRDGIDIDMQCVKGDYTHKYYLQKKVVEEASELRDAKTKDHIVEEIVDVLEVINALCLVENISKETIENVKNQKRQQRGGFDEGYIMNKKV